MINIKETRTIKYTPSLFWLKKDAFLEATEAEMVERFEKRLTTYEVMDDETFQYSLYVDTETTAVSRENYTEQLCKTFETKVEDIFREVLIVLMGSDFKPNITIASSHTANYKEDQTKISLHLHVSNVIATKQQQRRFIHQMNLMSFANRNVPYNVFDYIPHMENLFDESVYSVERKMRCVNTSKPNECRPLILVKGNLINTIITRHDPDARVMEDFNDGPVYTKSNFVSPFDNGITESPYNEELLFYAESGAFANMVGSGCHQKWLSLAGMLVSILPVEDAFTCWEQATMRDGTINKQCEYEAKFNHVKKLMDDPLKAMNSLKKTIKHDYPTIAQEWKQRVDIAKETAKQQLCNAVKTQKEAIKAQKEAVKAHIETGNSVHTSNTYLELKEEFEKTHFKVIETSSFFTLDEEGRVKKVSSKADFKSAYEHMPFKFISNWFSDPNMHLYESADVYPPDQVCPEGVFNLWIPFEMEFVKVWVHNQEGIDAIRKHILILCGNDKVGADYFEKWIGQMIQFPSVKTICPTFISKQGAGKGQLTYFMGKMFGTKKVANEITDPSRDVWGPFNSMMRDSFLVNLDEATGKDSKDAQGKFKGLVKSETITINEKGQKQQIIRSYHRWIITTNGLNGAIAIHKDDRRNCVYRSSDELIGNVSYFNKLREMFNDTNVIKSAYEYFKNLSSCESFNAIPIPHSAYHNELAELTVSPIESWLKDYTSEFYNSNGNKQSNQVQLRTNACFDMFNEWKGKTRVEYEINSLKFAVQLGRLEVKGMGSIKANDGSTRNVMFKTFDLQEMHLYFKL